jgi:hypothetical protein
MATVAFDKWFVPGTEPWSVVPSDSSQFGEKKGV